MTGRAPPTDRKRHGVVYTPAWAAELLVEAALGPWFDAARRADPAGYPDRLASLRVVDPACGEGAFLIPAFHRLLAERRAAQPGVTEAELAAHILAHNLTGLDRDPAALETLSRTLPCRLIHGDALAPGSLPDAAFDIVLGNPPFVRRQQLQASDPDLAARLAATYATARSGNFDLYLPFIERGLALLAPGGRMALIAPSLWPTARYGAPLRALVYAGRHLERWVDFGARQVFPDATAYAALQVFTREPTAGVQMAFDMDEPPPAAIPWDSLPPDREWLIAPPADRALVQRLAQTCLRLDDPRLTAAIATGVQTSADDLYHLTRLGPGRYRCTPNPRLRPGEAPYDTRIEDALMRPLVCGPHAGRYAEPATDRYVLFPYARDPAAPLSDKGGRMTLIPQAALAAQFPQAWAHLQRWAPHLRARERGAFDDDANWHRFGRHQNLDLQDRPKLMVPRLVRHLKAALDDQGRYVLDNVDVGAVIAAGDADAGYLLACLNGPVADHVFRTLAKPFRGDYRSANRQYIAPLPIPDASPGDRAAIAARARAIQAARTRGEDTTAEEASLHESLFALYGLSPAERALVEAAGPA